MNESTSDLFAMEYQFEYGSAPAGDTPYVTGAVRHRRQARGHPQLRHEQEPAELQRHRLRPGRPAGARRRRDLVGDPVRRAARRSSSGTARAPPTMQRACADGRPGGPSAPHRRWVAAVLRRALLMASGAVSYVDHSGRDPRRGRHPLRRREPGAALARLRPARPR